MQLIVDQSLSAGFIPINTQQQRASLPFKHSVLESRKVYNNDDKTFFFVFMFPSPCVAHPWSHLGLVLFEFILYIPVNNLSVMSGRVFLGWTSTKQSYCALLKDKTQWSWWGSNLRSRVKHSTTESLCSPDSGLAIVNTGKRIFYPLILFCGQSMVCLSQRINSFIRPRLKICVFMATKKF